MISDLFRTNITLFVWQFTLSNEGTIFLDEIGTVSSNIQVKLLQVLQERFIQRIGGSDQINLDIRIVAATNDNLDDLVANKTFREDLLYRLKVFHIPIPPLRKKKKIFQCYVKIYFISSILRWEKE